MSALPSEEEVMAHASLDLCMKDTHAMTLVANFTRETEVIVLLK